MVFKLPLIFLGIHRLTQMFPPHACTALSVGDRRALTDARMAQRQAIGMTDALTIQHATRSDRTDRRH